VLVDSGYRVRPGCKPAVPLADADPLDGEQRAAQQRAELGEDRAEPFPGADGDHHHRDLGVPAEERRPFPAPVRGPVDAEQRGRPGDAAPVEQVTDGHEGGHTVNALLAADVDRQLGLVARPVARRDRLDVRGADVVAQEPSPLQGDETGSGDLGGRLDQGLDPGLAVDRDRGQRQVIGKGERHVSARVALRAEPVCSAQQDAGRDLVPAVQVEKRVGGEPSF
jgi:hypothetical protein